MRERASISQQELADRIEIARNSVGNYESNRYVPKWMVASAWAMACNVDPEDLRPLWEAVRMPDTRGRAR
jgi:DNA-binding XRE family transcriptional regulator